MNYKIEKKRIKNTIMCGSFEAQQQDREKDKMAANVFSWRCVS